MDRPFVVCHMLSSLDGKIDGEFFSAPECRPALAEYGNLRGFYGCKKPWIVPIPGTRKAERLKENAGAADVNLTEIEVTALDKALDRISMSAVFGGSKIIK